MESLKVSRLVDRDISVDCHADDDVDAARHEGVDQWQHQMSLEKRCGVVTYDSTVDQ